LGSSPGTAGYEQKIGSLDVLLTPSGKPKPSVAGHWNCPLPIVVVVVLACVLVVIVVVVVVVVVPHTFAVVAPHVAGGVQLPQLTMSPQSSTNVPQLNPSLAHVLLGVQAHWPGTPPPPQVSGAAHTFPQAPQLLESVAKFTHAVPQRLLPPGQQVPNSARPCLTTGLAQTWLQQLASVAHCWPFGLHMPACPIPAVAKTSRKARMFVRRIA
jgi:hypothetical protein